LKELTKVLNEAIDEALQHIQEYLNLSKDDIFLLIGKDIVQSTKSDNLGNMFYGFLSDENQKKSLELIDLFNGVCSLYINENDVENWFFVKNKIDNSSNFDLMKKDFSHIVRLNETILN
jgi:hypothetical protein